MNAEYLISSDFLSNLNLCFLIEEQNRTLVYYSLTSTYTHARTMIYMIETFLLTIMRDFLTYEKIKFNIIIYNIYTLYLDFFTLSQLNKNMEMD